MLKGRKENRDFESLLKSREVGVCFGLVYYLKRTLGQAFGSLKGFVKQFGTKTATGFVTE